MPTALKRLRVMPLRPKEENTEYIEAGPLAFGVEFRYLPVEDVMDLYRRDGERTGWKPPDDVVDETGVSIHVYEDRGGSLVEYLRFDCFLHDPHYHYICWDKEHQDLAHIDTVADGEALPWAMERLRTRLPHMLAQAGGAELAKRVEGDPAVRAALDKVEAAAVKALDRLPVASRG